MKIAISAESTIDLPSNLLKKFDIHTTPFTINLDEQVIPDEQGVSSKIYDFVEKTKKLPKTSAVNQIQFEEHFASLLKSFDAVVHVSLSSMISSACQNALTAAKNFDNVYVVDSKTLSTGIALLAIRARKLADSGLDAKTVANKIQNLTPNVQAGFILENLQYLYRGGRCSSLALFGANLLKIKPQIIVNEQGKMVLGKKFIGNFGVCVEKYANQILSDYKNPDLENVFITHSSTMDEIVQKLTAKLKERGFENVYDTFAGGTISSHCGPNCIGILFLNK